MTKPEELKRKLSNPLVGVTTIPGGIPSATSSQNQLSYEPERTYVFPGSSGGTTVTIDSSGDSSGDNAGSTGADIGGAGRLSTIFGSAMSRGHARSVSHGGGQIATPSGTAGRPLKSAMRGHQRALSHGQISEVSTPQPTRSGHSRVGSKTDFILPPGHKDTLAVPTTSNPTSARGHSRQASRSESIYTLRHTEMPPWWKRFMFFRSKKFEERGYRIVVPNHTVPPKTPKRDHPNGRRIGNKIRTTKYTILSFLPKNLLEQFHRVANLYFIFIVLLNWFPAINAFGKEIAMIPVLFVLGVTAIKDLFEDRRRRASDKRINNSSCRVYNG